MYESIIYKLDKIIKLLEVNYKQQKVIIRLLSKGKPSDCPLVEVPTPHGRLIDADKLMKPFRDLLEKDEHSLDYYSVSYEGLNVMIDNAPTVIESEEQEHDT